MLQIHPNKFCSLTLKGGGDIYQDISVNYSLSKHEGNWGELIFDIIVMYDNAHMHIAYMIQLQPECSSMKSALVFSLKSTNTSNVKPLILEENSLTQISAARLLNFLF